MKIDTRDLISISEFSRKPSSYVTNLKSRQRKVILRNNEPIAVLVTAEEMERLDTERQDAVDLVLALTRRAADSGARRSAEDVFADLGIDWDGDEETEEEV